MRWLKWYWAHVLRALSLDHGLKNWSAPRSEPDRWRALWSYVIVNTGVAAAVVAVVTAGVLIHLLGRLLF